MQMQVRVPLVSGGPPTLFLAFVTCFLLFPRPLAMTISIEEIIETKAFAGPAMVEIEGAFGASSVGELARREDLTKVLRLG